MDRLDDIKHDMLFVEIQRPMLIRLVLHKGATRQRIKQLQPMYWIMAVNGVVGYTYRCSLFEVCIHL